jgi:hypothetical protein
MESFVNLLNLHTEFKFIRNTSRVMSQRVSLSMKKRREMFSVGNDAHPVGYSSLLQIIMVV